MHRPLLVAILFISSIALEAQLPQQGQRPQLGSTGAFATSKVGVARLDAGETSGEKWQPLLRPYAVERIGAALGKDFADPQVYPQDDMQLAMRLGGGGAGAASKRGRSYGLQVFLADLVTVGLAGAVGGNVAIISWFAAPAIVHMRHGNRHGALVSAAFRAALPLGCAGLGKVTLGDIEDVEPDFPVNALGALLGGAVGVIASSAIDWFFVAREKSDVSARADLKKEHQVAGIATGCSSLAQCVPDRHGGLFLIITTRKDPVVDWVV